MSRVAPGRRYLPAMTFAVLALLCALLPIGRTITSLASLSASASATANTASATTCTSTAWNTLVTNTANIPSNSQDAFQRLSGDLTSDVWMSSSAWTNSSMLLNQAGALYCDSNLGVSTPAVSGSAAHVDSASVSQSTFFTSGTTANATVMFWFQTTTASAGRLASIGNGAASDRVIWVDASGYLRFSAWASNTSSTWSTAAAGKPVNDGSWHLVVAIMGTTSPTGGGVSLYLDGVSIATQAAGSSYNFRTGYGSSGFGTNPAYVSWTLGSQTATAFPTGVPKAGAAPASYDEFVQFDTTNLSGTLLGTGTGSLYRSADI